MKTRKIILKLYTEKLNFKNKLQNTAKKCKISIQVKINYRNKYCTVKNKREKHIYFPSLDLPTPVKAKLHLLPTPRKTTSSGPFPISSPSSLNGSLFLDRFKTHTHTLLNENYNKIMSAYNTKNHPLLFYQNK